MDTVSLMDTVAFRDVGRRQYRQPVPGTRLRVVLIFPIYGKGTKGLRIVPVLVVDLTAIVKSERLVNRKLNTVVFAKLELFFILQ